MNARREGEEAITIFIEGDFFWSLWERFHEELGDAGSSRLAWVGVAAKNSAESSQIRLPKHLKMEPCDRATVQPQLNNRRHIC